MQLAVHHSRCSERAEACRAWKQLRHRLEEIDRDALIGRQLALSREGRPPKGGQRALNELISDALAEPDWVSNGRVFRPKPALPGWRLSFQRDGLGIVVCTQNVGYLAQKLLTLQVAAGAEMSARWPPSEIDVGVLVVPTPELKSWSHMDTTVTTYQDALAQNAGLEGILTAPIVVVGLDARTDGVVWEPTRVFPGKGV